VGCDRLAKCTVGVGTGPRGTALAQSLNFLHQRRARHTKSSGSTRYITTARRDRLVDQTRFEFGYRGPKVDRRAGAGGRTDGLKWRCGGAVRRNFGIL
jgi:hypothetical protein